MLLAIPFPDLSPTLIEFTVGSVTLAIRWYALAYIVGIVIGDTLYLVALRTRHARGDLDTAELHAAEQRLRAWLAGRDEPGLARFAAAWDLVD